MRTVYCSFSTTFRHGETDAQTYLAARYFTHHHIHSILLRPLRSCSFDVVRFGSEEQRRVLAGVGGAVVELYRSPYAHYIVVKLLQVDTSIPIFFVLRV